MSDTQTKTAEPTVAQADVEETAQPTAAQGDSSQPGDEIASSDQGGAQPTDSDFPSGDQPPSSGQDGQPVPVADGSAEQNKLRIISKALKNIERDINNVIRLLESGASLPPRETIQAMTSVGAVANMAREEAHSFKAPADGRVVEGVFDGQNMVGSDGKIYTVPANYASKSKLVEGDMLKLTITPRGSFIYKQIGPIERNRVMATLGFDPTIGEYYAADDSRRWNVLKASVTYYRGEVGDELVLLVPKSAPSKWAAVENIIKTNPLDDNGYGGYRQPNQGGGDDSDQAAGAAPVSDQSAA